MDRKRRAEEAGAEVEELLGSDPPLHREAWHRIKVRSRTDYILGTDCRLFGNFSVWDPRHNSDHYMVLGCLHSASLKEHARYPGGRKRPPLRPPTEPTREDTIFAALRRDVLKRRAREARKNAWILATTWRLVDERVSMRQDLAKYQARPYGVLRRLLRLTSRGSRRRGWNCTVPLSKMC